MIGADLLCDSLLAYGIDVCFANPGTSEMHFVAALDRKPQMRCVLGLFEGVVTGAADGYGRMRGRPAATLLHTGSGLGNGLANLHNAKRAGTPIVNVVGDHASGHLKWDSPLTSDIDVLAKPMSNWVGRPAGPDQIARSVADAYQHAMLSPGPATLILPADSAWGEVTASGPIAMAEPVRAAPSASTVHAVAAAIREHRGRFAILVGHQAALEAGASLAQRIADAEGGKLFAEVRPARVERGQGRTSPPSIPYAIDKAIAVLKDVDLLVLVGAKEPVPFFAYPGRSHRFLADPAPALLLATMAEDQVAGLEALADELAVSRVARVSSRPRLEPAEASGSLTGDLVCELLARALPENAILCDEGLTTATRFFDLCHRAAPHDALYVTGGAIGIGIPMAVGAAIACPDRKVVNLQADGSGLYTLQGLWTQAREHLDVVTLILANRSYASLTGELKNLGVTEVGRNATRMMSLDEPPIDWVDLAHGFGVEARRVETAEALGDLLAVAMKRPGPFLIECLI